MDLFCRFFMSFLPSSSRSIGLFLPLLFFLNFIPKLSSVCFLRHSFLRTFTPLSAVPFILADHQGSFCWSSVNHLDQDCRLDSVRLFFPSVQQKAFLPTVVYFSWRFIRFLYFLHAGVTKRIHQLITDQINGVNWQWIRPNYSRK